MRRQSEPAGEDEEGDVDVDINLDQLFFSPPPPWADGTTPGTARSSQHTLPALVSDHGASSEESEESDALVSPQGRGNASYFPYGGDVHMGGRQMDFLPHASSRHSGADREREREKEIRRRRRREREEEERGRWKTDRVGFGGDDGSCLGGF